MARGLATVDYVAILGYLIAISAIGSSFFRRKTTARDYFLGGRSISWLPAGISVLASDFSAVSIMGMPAWVYSHNIELLLIPFISPLIAPLIARIFLPTYASGKFYTAYEYLEKRFSLAIRLFASGTFVLLRAFHVSLAIYAPSLIINLVTGMPLWQCVMVMGILTTIYTSLGGIKAVIWTDTIQFFVVFTGLALIVINAAHHIRGGFPVSLAIAHSAGRLQFMNFSLDPRVQTSFWACILGGVVQVMGPLTTDQAVLQRFLTTRSLKDSTRSLFLYSFGIIPLATMLNFAGIILFAFYRQNPSRLAGLTNSDALVPFFVVHELPGGFAGLIVAAIFAASMAVMSAGINSLTTVTTVDFYQRLLRPGRTPEHYAKVGRISTLSWGVLVTLMAVFGDRLGDLGIAYIRVSSLIAGPMLGIFLLGMLSKHATSGGAWLGIAVGAVLVFWVAVGTNWSFLYYGVVGTLGTLAVGYFSSRPGKLENAASKAAPA